MAYIQQLPVAGSGKKLYPDAAMDAGTRGLIDMLDPWSWGGDRPGEGSVLPLGIGPRNYPLADDGWVEDAAAAGSATLAYAEGGIGFSHNNDRLNLPVGFRHRADDRHLGYIFWLNNQAVVSPPAQNNSIFASLTAANNAQNIAINPGYSVAGVLTNLYFRTELSASQASPAAVVDAIKSGDVHQFGFEFEIAPGNATVAFRFYLDSELISETSAAVTGAFTAPGANDYAALGRHGAFTGSGLNGHAYRALCQQLDVADARPMAETVALDWRLNAARIGGD